MVSAKERGKEMGVDAAQVRRFRQLGAYRTLFLPRSPGVAFEDKWALHDYAAEHLGLDAVVTYLEFGVAGGQSIRKFAERFTNPATRLVGFDSFEGLPEDWHVDRRIIQKGTFAAGGKAPSISDNRISFVKGWFQNSVPLFLRHPTVPLNGSVLIHYDADLYSSTLFLLTNLWPHISQYYFIMDDFFQDDMIALHDFTIAYPVELEWIAYHRNPANLPFQVLGKLKRTDFKLEKT
jgi:hypothetical protein